VTSGPGITNMITSMTDAQNDGIPLIVLSGQVPLNAMGTSAFQECPAVDISRPITKWSYCLENINEIPYIIDRAFEICMNDKKGVVHIDLPKCILTQDQKNKNGMMNIIEFDDHDLMSRDKNWDYGLQKKIIDSAEIINKSERPLFFLGKGAINATDEIRKIAKKCNIPVTTTLHGMGIFDETDDLALKMVGMHGSVTANNAVQKSDLIIAVGSRFDDRTIGIREKYAPNAKIIQINNDKKEHNKMIKTDIFFEYESKYIMKNLDFFLDENISSKEWLDYIKESKEKYKFDYEKTEKMKTQDVIIGVNNYLKNSRLENYYITTGVGNHQMMCAQYIDWKYPGSIITSGSLGVMGAGLPYAIGCQIANPNSLVIDIDGDGSFNMTAMELITIKRYNLPIKIILINNKSQDMVRVWEKLFFNNRIVATELPNNPDYKNFGESFGIKSLRCSIKSDINGILEETFNDDGPVIVEFDTEIDYCLPLVAPGRSLDNHFNYQDGNLEEMIDGCEPPS